MKVNNSANAGIIPIIVQNSIKHKTGTRISVRAPHPKVTAALFSSMLCILFVNLGVANTTISTIIIATTNTCKSSCK